MNGIKLYFSGMVEIWYGDSAWKTGGRHVTLLSTYRPQITYKSIGEKCQIKKKQFKTVVLVSRDSFKSLEA